MYKPMCAVLTRRDKSAPPKQAWLTKHKGLSDSRVDPAQQLENDNQQLKY